jgi:hypothetical protein
MASDAQGVGNCILSCDGDGRWELWKLLFSFNLLEGSLTEFIYTKNDILKFLHHVLVVSLYFCKSPSFYIL